MILILAYLIVAEYSPRRLWPLHWLLWVCAAVGVAALLIARGHYTVEISWFEDFSSNILRSTW